MLQRSVFSFANTTPREIVRSRISVPEIQQRALSYIPDEILHNIPEDNNEFSLFQGFQASLPDEPIKGTTSGKRNARGQKLIGEELDDNDGSTPPSMQKLKNQKHSMNHRLEMMGVRKHMCVAEILEIDHKIANLNTLRKMTLERLAGLEIEEAELEQDLLGVDNRIEDLQEELDDEVVKYDSSPLEIGFQARYLNDITDQIADMVEFRFADGSAPTVVTDAAKPEALYVLMPMRV